MRLSPPELAPVAVVTGATSGIGRFVALGLARAGYRLVLPCRSASRAVEARNWLKAQVPEAALETPEADLSLLASTRELAETVLARHERIALLVNNAGVFRARRSLTAEGHETVLATNHLAPFVLMRALEPALRAAAPSRIVLVGSSTSDRARLDPADLERRRGWTMTGAYAGSKLAAMMAAFEMAGRLSGSAVVANVVHPGAVATGLVRNAGPIGLAWRLMRPFLLTEEQGADTPLWAATAPEAAALTGRYFKRCREAAPNPLARDEALRRRVWDATEALTAA